MTTIMGGNRHTQARTAVLFGIALWILLGATVTRPVTAENEMSTKEAADRVKELFPDFFDDAKLSNVERNGDGSFSATETTESGGRTQTVRYSFRVKAPSSNAGSSPTAASTPKPSSKSPSTTHSAGFGDLRLFGRSSGSGAGAGFGGLTFGSTNTRVSGNGGTASASAGFGFGGDSFSSITSTFGSSGSSLSAPSTTTKSPPSTVTFEQTPTVKKVRKVVGDDDSEKKGTKKAKKILKDVSSGGKTVKKTVTVEKESSNGLADAGGSSTVIRAAPSPVKIATTTKIIGGSSVVGGCSDTETSQAAVERCVNAVRANPQAFAEELPCDIPHYSARKPLKTHTILTQSASGHAKDMAGMKSVTHTGSDGSSMGERVYKRAQFRGPAIAENVAGGQKSAKKVVFAWMCSAGHRENIMSCKYDSMGTGIATNDWIYWTQNFGCTSADECTC